ncbi:hypothetical protein [Paenibacillus koleovorans]|uniref:hypothetical protein n=1 Tax=Paenibacillus koleovorans TaxID=121608 RepID=UPI000FD927EF|nr:hypothetical protein [Paenibacillus koleovorans]
MSVQIIVSGDTAEEALIKIAALANGLKTGQLEPVAIPAAEPEKPKRPRQSKPEEVKQPEPPVVEPEEENDDDYLGEEPLAEPIPTDVQLREIAKSKSDADTAARAAIKALLTKYGVANITGVPEAKRIAFKRELEAL